jgi:hypothetical protein
MKNIMITQCANCNETINFKSWGSWLNYSNGLGAPDAKCPKCKNKVLTGRRFWNELETTDKLQVYAKLLVGIPIGIIISLLMAYLHLTTRDHRSGMRAVFGNKEAIELFIANPVPVLLFAFTASLAANITLLKQAIKSSTLVERGW